MDSLQWNCRNWEYQHFHKEISIVEFPSQGLSMSLSVRSSHAETPSQEALLFTVCSCVVLDFAVIPGSHRSLHIEPQPGHEAAVYSIYPSAAQTADTKSPSGHLRGTGSCQGKGVWHKIEQTHSEKHCIKLNQCLPRQGQLRVLNPGTGGKRSPLQPWVVGSGWGATAEQSTCSKARTPQGHSPVCRKSLTTKCVILVVFLPLYHRSYLSVLTDNYGCVCLLSK